MTEPHVINAGDADCEHKVKVGLPDTVEIDGQVCNIFECRVCGWQGAYPKYLCSAWHEQARKAARRRRKKN